MLQFDNVASFFFSFPRHPLFSIHGLSHSQISAMTMNENENKNVNYNVCCKRGFYKRKFIKKKMKEKREKLFKMDKIKNCKFKRK